MRWIGIGIACFAAILGFLLCRQKPLATPEISFWFWQTPYTLTLQDREDLKRIGVRKMFVRAGTFTTDGKSVVLRFPQKYGPGANALPVHLVFNFDGGVVRHFEKFELDAMAEDVARRIKIQWESARAAGLKVEGYQLDFDSPTRLLPRYAQLLKRIRGKLPKTTVSATGLMSWLGTPQLRVLSRELDFLVPQAYEGETGLTVDKMRPISDPEYLKRALPEAESLACPYYVGLPTYGRALQYDDRGRLTGPYRGLSAGDAARHPAFKIERAFPTDRLGQPANEGNTTGEELLFLKAIKASSTGEGLGYTIAYSIPTPEMVRGMVAAAMDARGPECRGFVFYRFPEKGDSLNVGIEGIEAAIRGETRKPQIEVQVEAARDNFGALEKGGEPGMDVFVTIRNTGAASAFIADGSVEIDFEITGSKILEARPRDMDSASLKSSGHAQFRRNSLASGESAQIGPIRLLSNEAKACTIRWRVRDPGGFETLSGIRENLPLRGAP